MVKIKVANAIVKVMESEKTKFVFGLPGSPTLPLYDALYDSDIQHILVRHEQTASFAADAYAKITGEVGVCDASSGPGLMNLAIGIATSWIDSSSVIALTGERKLWTIGEGTFQYLDQLSIFRPITKWNTIISKANKTVDIMRTAYRNALTGRPGPVHIVLPQDILLEEIEGEIIHSLRAHRPTTVAKGDPEQIKEALKLLLKAERPVILAGGGCHYSTSKAHAELIKLAETLWIPVASTLNGRGSFPEDHPLSIGRTGVYSANYVHNFILQADVLLAVGCRFADLSTSHWKIINPETQIIHIDIDPSEIGKNYPVEIGIVGDAKSILNEFSKYLADSSAENKFRDSAWVKSLEKAKNKWLDEIQKKITSNAIPLKPQRVLKEIRKFFDRRTIFTLDAGEHKMLAATFLDIYEPGSWIQSGEFGPMGYALPAAIGCKVARPENNVVAIAGDGGFSMVLQELSTALQNELPIICCILNNNCFGSIKTNQRLQYRKRYISVDLLNPDFTKVAESFGCYGERVEKPSEIIPALKNALKASEEGLPAVIEFLTDPKEIPPRKIYVHS